MGSSESCERGATWARVEGKGEEKNDLQFSPRCIASVLGVPSLRDLPVNLPLWPGPLGRQGAADEMAHEDKPRTRTRPLFGGLLRVSIGTLLGASYGW